MITIILMILLWTPFRLLRTRPHKKIFLVTISHETLTIKALCSQKAVQSHLWAYFFRKTGITFRRYFQHQNGGRTCLAHPRLHMQNFPVCFCICRIERLWMITQLWVVNHGRFLFSDKVRKGRFLTTLCKIVVYYNTFFQKNYWQMAKNVI